MKNLYSTVNKNIEISKSYIHIYPCLKRYDAINIEIENCNNERILESLRQERTNIYAKFKYLNLYKVWNFLYAISGKNEQYLTNEKSADPLEVLNDIKTDLNDYLNLDTFKEDYKYYNKQEHQSVKDIKKVWDKVITEEDFFKVLTGKQYGYTTIGDFDPFYNESKQRSSKLINIIINHNLELDFNNELDLELDCLLNILETPDAEEAEIDILLYNKDKRDIEDIIKILIPICRRAKEIDSQWEHNFFSNKILSEIKKQL